MQYVVAVRALCEFTAKQGDLDLRFTPSPSAQEGIAAHQRAAARRGAGYEAELALAGEYGALSVRGRADGYDAAANRLDEVKSHRGRLDRQPGNHRALHWAQALVYGWLLCAERGLQELELALVYVDVVTQDETVFTRRCTAQELRAHFDQRCSAFLAWAEQELAHRAARDAALQALRFPHAGFRVGQRELAEAAFKAARSGRCLMAQAPTGIGKTVGTLFPLLKAMPASAIDKAFFLTAKTPGRALALEAVQTLRRDAGTLPLRALELVARDKACEHPDKACHGASCPLAQGFYDRLPAAREAALAQPQWDKAAVRALALQHGVCPYYLTQELARWSDLAVGDYNHFFDGQAMLHGLATGQGLRVSLLVDEAHNLVDRARAMYSASLDPAGFRAARRGAPAALRKPLERVQRQWTAMTSAQQSDYEVLAAPPPKLLLALQQAISALTEHFAEHPEPGDAALQSFYFEALQFTRLAEDFGEHSLFDLTREPVREGARPGHSVPCIRNVVPAPFLQPRWKAAHGATLFSATLQPQHFHARMLGLPEDSAWIDVASPFEARQLQVTIARALSTRWQRRAQSLQPIAELIARQYDERPGHYLAFFSSFEYLQQVAGRFQAARPDVPVWLQSRGMAEAEREAFLARFMPGGRGVGFAVLGGAFAEGIDLPGDRLVGAFVATLGLPQVNPVNEEMRRRLQQLTGSGFDYTYLYPGVQKVVQAAGRVIRTPTDEGVLHLLDERFGRREVRALLPAWWDV